VDPKLLEILACPKTKEPLTIGKGGNYLICESAGLAYPIIDGIPYLLESSAIQLQKIGIADMSADTTDTPSKDKA
jgi:uncharacterized protein